MNMSHLLENEFQIKHNEHNLLTMGPTSIRSLHGADLRSEHTLSKVTAAHFLILYTLTSRVCVKDHDFTSLELGSLLAIFDLFKY